MMYTMILQNWTPYLANRWVGRHWRVKHRMRKEMSKILAAEATAQGVPPATGPRQVRLRCTGWANGGRLPDADAPVKLFLDALRVAGLILDDSAKGLVGSLEVEFERDAERVTTITFEEE